MTTMFLSKGFITKVVYLLLLCIGVQCIPNDYYLHHHVHHHRQARGIVRNHHVQNHHQARGVVPNDYYLHHHVQHPRQPRGVVPNDFYLHHHSKAAGAVPTKRKAGAVSRHHTPRRHTPRRPQLSNAVVFDVTKYGAIADGNTDKTDNAMSFIQAWNAVCHSKRPAKLFIPKGIFSAGEIVFAGPCSAPKPIVIEIQGTLLGDTDLSLYPMGVWITIEHVDGVLITGGGTINGQGEAVWKYKTPGSGNGAGSLLPNTLEWHDVTNSVMQNINLVNSKGFHMKVHRCNNIKMSNLHITAPENSPNTDGCHISDSTNIAITNSVIRTGDDCISIGDGNIGITISKIFCGPGHGISIGSLGKYEDETNVKGIRVTNCTFTGTTNGARIKSYRASLPLQASDIVYEDLVMHDVKNPIIIDQQYNSKTKKEGSRVKISDVHFRNIRGTTNSQIAVNLNCSDVAPCENIELSNIDLRQSSMKVGPLTTSYAYAKYYIGGRNAPFLH